MNTRELYKFACRVTRSYRNQNIGARGYREYTAYTPQRIIDAAWYASVNRGMNSIRAGLDMNCAYKRKQWFKTH